MTKGLSESVVIIGGGAAGNAAAATLRTERRMGRIDVDDEPAAHDCTLTYWRDDRRLAMATVGCELDRLRA
ncbi:MAG: hypothetical protein ACREVO_07635 [Steroidobacteraceae bacterium]